MTKENKENAGKLKIKNSDETDQENLLKLLYV